MQIQGVKLLSAHVDLGLIRLHTECITDCDCCQGITDCQGPCAFNPLNPLLCQGVFYWTTIGPTDGDTFTAYTEQLVHQRADLITFRSTVIQSSLSLRESAAQIHSRFDVRSLNAFCTTTAWKKNKNSLTTATKYTTLKTFICTSLLTTLPSAFWRCWLGARKGIQPVETEWCGTGMVVCLERSANDLHMVQLMPLPPRRLLLR